MRYRRTLCMFQVRTERIIILAMCMHHDSRTQHKTLGRVGRTNFLEALFRAESSGPDAWGSRTKAPPLLSASVSPAVSSNCPRSRRNRVFLLSCTALSRPLHYSTHHTSDLIPLVPADDGHFKRVISPIHFMEGIARFWGC